MSVKFSLQMACFLNQSILIIPKTMVWIFCCTEYTKNTHDSSFVHKVHILFAFLCRFFSRVDRPPPFQWFVAFNPTFSPRLPSAAARRLFSTGVWRRFAARGLPAGQSRKAVDVPPFWAWWSLRDGILFFLLEDRP